MSWQRLPTYFLNFPLKLMPFTEKQQKLYEQTGHVKELAFRTIPSIGKVEIRQCLQRLYGLKVKKVHTVNVEGTKKRSRYGYYREPDFKKAYVILHPQGERAPSKQ